MAPRLGWLLLPEEREVELWRGGQQGMAERLENASELESSELAEELATTSKGVGQFCRQISHKWRGRESCFLLTGAEKVRRNGKDGSICYVVDQRDGIGKQSAEESDLHSAISIWRSWV